MRIFAKCPGKKQALPFQRGEEQGYVLACETQITGTSRLNLAKTSKMALSNIKQGHSFDIDLKPL